MEENQKPNIPLLCRNGCGFYGSPNFDGLCSKCHRCAQAEQTTLEARLSATDLRRNDPADIARKMDSPTDKDSNASPHNVSDGPSDLPAATSCHSAHPPDPAPSETDAESAPTSLPKNSPCTTDANSESSAPRKPRRCEVCRKHVGLANGYTCRCEGLFCSLHRYTDAHNCSFDYRKAGQEDIRRTNPQIMCPKLPKI